MSEAHTVPIPGIKTNMWSTQPSIQYIRGQNKLKLLPLWVQKVKIVGVDYKTISLNQRHYNEVQFFCPLKKRSNKKRRGGLFNSGVFDFGLGLDLMHLVHWTC